MPKHEFNADVNQLIELVTHSIYSNKEIFLRELLSNASDALSKAQLKSLQDTNYLKDDINLQITVDVNAKEKLIVIKDNGIGMTKEEVIENIGTIAKSGTKKFIQEMKKDHNNNLIGQFWIGFYSVFMVAEKVELESKTWDSKGVLRISNGKGSYEIKESKKTTRGTEIRIYLQKDSEEFANIHRIKWLIKKHSNYLPYPIMMQEEKEEKEEKKENEKNAYEQINKSQSLRSKNKNEIKKEEYDEFYNSLSFDTNKPLEHIHLDVEWAINYKALLYIPQKNNPFANLMPDQEFGPQLYVQNILIMEQCKELLPQRLRFVKWVIETPDLPLNVSREILQNNQIINKVQSSLVKKVIETCKYKQQEDRNNYEEFFSNYGKILKEGIHFDRSNKEEIASICLFYSSKENKLISLDEYSDKSVGKEIYYLTGNNIKELKDNPYMEQFENSEHDVLLMTDPIDERVVQSLQTYKGCKLISAQHADIEHSNKSKKEKKVVEKMNEEHKDLLEYIKKILHEEAIDKVEFSHKLKEPLAVLKDKEGQPSLQMERYIKAMGQETTPIKRDLIINKDHPLANKIIEIYTKDKKSDSMKDRIYYLHNQALLQQWVQPANIQSFIKVINKLLQK